VPKKVALAAARALGVSLGEALWLVARGGALPREFSQVDAKRLEALFVDAGFAAEVVASPAGAVGRCATHPTLVTEGPCDVCRASMCAICSGLGAGRCGPCQAKFRRAQRFKRARVTLLAGVLLAVAAWVLSHGQRRGARTLWQRTLNVAVVEVSTAPVPELTRAVWDAGLPRLEHWLADEFERVRGSPMEPVHFTAVGPVAVPAFPELLPPSGAWLERAEHAWALSHSLSALDAAAGARGDFDARIYVLLEPGGERGRSMVVDGVGELGGEVGFVRAPLESTDITLELMAVAHELFHCLGATDKYDAEGHAAPGGLSEPARVPLYPQQFAEPMVGEVALGPRSGRLPASLSEIRVGPGTAAELRWQ